MFANTNLEYPILLLKSTGIKNFTQLATTASKSDKTIRRSLLSLDNIFSMFIAAGKWILKKGKWLYVIIDDTLIKKIYSELIQGTYTAPLTSDHFS